MDEALALAQYAPSNSNIQPWHTGVCDRAARDRLVTALLAEARSEPPKIPPLPESFQHLRSELGAKLYGAMGIAREDSEGQAGRESCATGSSSARRWPASSVSTGTSDPADCPLRGDVPADTAVGTDRPRPGDLRPGLHRGISRDRPRAAGHPRGILDSVRPGGRLPRPGLSREQAPHRPQPSRRARGIPRRLSRIKRRHDGNQDTGR